MSTQQFKYIRKKLNLSQATLGLLLDSEAQSIVYWEQGKVDTTSLADIELRTIYLESTKEKRNISLVIDTLL